MKVTAIRSDEIYKKMISSKPEDRDDIYRYELMKPFEFKWSCVGIPLESDCLGGYDVVIANSMGGGFAPSQINSEQVDAVEKISNESFWQACKESITKTLKGFEDNGISLHVKDYIFTILLNDPLNPMSKMTGDYCGDGGIPGYIIGTIIPNEKSLKMLPVVFAHETNHNVRWQFMQCNNKITLGDMVVSEGLAENFASFMFGEDKIGMWVKNTTTETLKTIIKPAIKENLNINDFNKLSAFLYGDEIVTMRGILPVGMPYCAGYACGYQLIKHYLNKTGKTIFEATITPTSDILKETEDFWN
ncbi:uncharacterized protein YjaZ [Clostridium tetanomorphum]|uniref:DUF2268 domain-containing protein n=1 Tax=Clostridium tetanomorphum TaxID=1553 RepID=A0A923J104_CLOTT|nr:DUF2268 domain-containing protein [Clostridium tetanomorphum]KAJ53744.1 hypothetical protein CTM_00705 [Clostridium tetanomorphum DSM 665]MBC2397255.1 DUF2268 domain-containing protein [Clostridium tetanomorphum]MBP1862472.1 uncharacterized protein YjaZ [Clostridium tetanomorphum]NRS85688.1 uncharacterized protein YjaZ [Clostridium tetanomorphum]NRZ96302.1 uncharacterized protein YjaZ [Clostridium tetanomorphum]